MKSSHQQVCSTGLSKEEINDLLVNIFKGNTINRCNREREIQGLCKLIFDTSVFVRKTSIALLIWIYKNDKSAEEKVFTNEVAGISMNGYYLLNPGQKLIENLDLYKATEKWMMLNSPDSDRDFENRVFFFEKDKFEQVKSLNYRKLLDYAYYGEIGWIPDPISTPIWISENLISINSNSNVEFSRTKKKKMKILRLPFLENLDENRIGNKHNLDNIASILFEKSPQDTIQDLRDQMIPASRMPEVFLNQLRPMFKPQGSFFSTTKTPSSSQTKEFSPNRKLGGNMTCGSKGVGINSVSPLAKGSKSGERLSKKSMFRISSTTPHSKIDRRATVSGITPVKRRFGDFQSFVIAQAKQRRVSLKK